MRRCPWYGGRSSATSASPTSSAASPATSEAVWPSAPSPRCTRSSTGGVPHTAASSPRVGRGARFEGLGLDRHRRGRSRAGIGAAREQARLERASSLRSGSPAGAMRSSTWKTCTCSQASAASARRLNMRHGVRPPLAAKAKRPRAASAGARGLGDQLGAAPRHRLGVGEGLERQVACAAAPGACQPPTRAASALRLLAAPRCPARRRRAAPGSREQRVDDAPGLLDLVLPREERRVAVHRVAEQALVGLDRRRRGRGRRRARRSRRLPRADVAGLCDPRAERDLHLGAEAEAQVVRRGRARTRCRRRRAAAAAAARRAPRSP